MNILVTNNHLDTYGGSETFTYALIEELCRRGFVVEYFTFHKGATSDLIEKQLGVNFMSRNLYDIVFSNHINCVEYLRLLLGSECKIIQTCHGIYPDLEQPSSYADYHISISEEVEKHLLDKGYTSTVILNGINCDRFKSEKRINKNVEVILSFCQSIEANEKLSKICKDLKIEFKTLNKFSSKPIWEVEEVINECDLVIGLGRSAYEAMSCGRPVVIFDNRSYFSSYGDGYLTLESVSNSVTHNCSGRASKKEFSDRDIIGEIQQYNKNDGKDLREYIITHQNIRYQTEKYLNIAESLSKKNILNKQNDKNKLVRHIYSECLNINEYYMPFITFTEFNTQLSVKEKQNLNLNLVNLINSKKELIRFTEENDWLKKQNKILLNDLNWLKKQNIIIKEARKEKTLFNFLVSRFFRKLKD